MASKTASSSTAMPVAGKWKEFTTHWGGSAHAPAKLKAADNHSDRAHQSGQPIIITQNGKATAVLQDVESYQRQRDALLLLKFLARGDRDSREGRIVSDEEADQRFRARLAAMKARD